MVVAAVPEKRGMSIQDAKALKLGNNSHGVNPVTQALLDARVREGKVAPFFMAMDRARDILSAKPELLGDGTSATSALDHDAIGAEIVGEANSRAPGTYGNFGKRRQD